MSYEDLEEEEGEPKINMLLDPDNYAGESEGRLGPLLIFFLVAGAPALIYAYFFWGKLPLWLVIPIYVIYVIRVAMITLGREKERLSQYKKQLNDEYASMYDLVSIKTLHPDGCCEYTGNKVAYFISTTNKTTYDAEIWSNEVKQFLKMLNTKYQVDIYVQNIIEVTALDKRYDGVKLFADPSVARDFIDIIDHNRSQVYQNSLMTRTIFVVRGYRNEWEDLKKDCNAAIHSVHAKVFKTCKLCNDFEVNEILSRDVNGLVNLPELMQNKYCTKQYYGSRVIAYDDADVKANEVEESHNSDTGGFMSQFQ